MSHLMLQELESNAPSISEGHNTSKPGFDLYGKSPYWLLEQLYERDYVEDITAMCRARHRREMTEINQRRVEANRRDRAMGKWGRGQ